MTQPFLSKNQSSLLGIYGGVGPLSHVQFEKELLSESFRRGARKDQDHPVWILTNASATPDRTGSLLRKETPSLPHMIHFAKLLENAGANCIFVICNTAHGYHKTVQKELSIPWIHLMHIVSEYITKEMPEIKSVGILGTDATIQLRLYHDALENFSLIPVAPPVDSPTQKDVMDAIYHKDFGVKATGDRVDKIAEANLISAATWCEENGADAIIAACTEVSVALTPDILPELPIIDPLKIAASVALDIAFGVRNPKEFMIR